MMHSILLFGGNSLHRMVLFEKELPQKTVFTRTIAQRGIRARQEVYEAVGALFCVT